MPARFHAEIESYTFPQLPLSDDCKRVTTALPVILVLSKLFLCISNQTHSFVFLECVGGCVLPTHMGEEKP